MFKKILRKTFLITSFLFFVGLFMPLLTNAGINSDPGASLKQSADMAGLENKDINQTVGTFVGQILSMIGVLFFVLVVYGGILWMTARGDTDQTSKAMKTIIAASIGIVLVLSAYAITNFVVGLTDSSNNTPSDNNSGLISQCQKDSDCPGNDICDNNVCVSSNHEGACFCSDKKISGSNLCINVRNYNNSMQTRCKFLCYGDRNSSKSISAIKNTCNTLPACQNGNCTINSQ